MRTPVSEFLPPAGGTVLLARDEGARIAAVLEPDGAVAELTRLPSADDEASRWIERVDAQAAPRWVWNDTTEWYPELLAAGVRVARCHDLRLAHIVLRHATSVREPGRVFTNPAWNAPAREVAAKIPTLFEWEHGHDRLPSDVAEAGAEYRRQLQAIADSADPNRLRMLCAGESAGALIACELHAVGLPWDRKVHERILDESLGVRDATGVPVRVAALAAQVRSALGDPSASLDSQQKLLRALHRVGVLVESTSRWELAEQRHPVIEPLLEYKKLTRLQSANGRAWLDEWVTDGRFRPVYVPSGVVTGRWASSGGGALQIPRALREAVRADEGWTMVVADVAQLEPRVLAAMAGDVALAEAARGRDLYAGIVASGAVASRDDAKIAMLGAMYGATTGESGRLVPRLRRTYPRAMQLVDDAARTGEDGGVVSTWLGRTCPQAPDAWRRTQTRASEQGASELDISTARRQARDRGRFTRNFVVQGTAAEWALVWLADLRARLQALPPVAVQAGAPRSGPVFAQRPHLAFFLHDEVIIHTPHAHADAVAAAVRDAAAAAGRLVFGGFPIDFPLDVNVGMSALKG